MKLLLSPRYSDDSQLLWQAASAVGWQVYRPGWLAIGLEHVEAIYGETLWCRVVAGQLGASLLDPPEDWLCTVPRRLLNRTVRYGRLYELSIEFPAFIKPADVKSFRAGVYSAFPGPNLDDEAVLVSEVLNIECEVRTWILEGRALTGAFYGSGAPEEPALRRRMLSDALRFAKEVAQSPRTPRAVVIDVAVLSSGRFAVVEANAPYCSGIYEGADPGAVLEVVRASFSAAQAI